MSWLILHLSDSRRALHECRVMSNHHHFIVCSNPLTDEVRSVRPRRARQASVDVRSCRHLHVVQVVVLLRTVERLPTISHGMYQALSPNLCLGKLIACRNVRNRACNRITPSQIRTTGLTHIYFSFLNIDPVSFAVVPAHPGDVALFTEFTALQSSTFVLQRFPH